MSKPPADKSAQRRGMKRDSEGIMTQQVVVNSLEIYDIPAMANTESCREQVVHVEMNEHTNFQDLLNANVDRSIKGRILSYIQLEELHSVADYLLVTRAAEAVQLWLRLHREGLIGLLEQADKT